MSIVFRAFLRGAFLFVPKAASSYSFGALVCPVCPRGRAAAAALHPALSSVFFLCRRRLLLTASARSFILFARADGRQPPPCIPLLP